MTTVALTLALAAGVIVLGTALGIVMNSLRHRNNQLKSVIADRAKVLAKLDETRLDSNKRSVLLKQATISEQTLLKEVSQLKSKLRNSHQRVGKKMMPLGVNPDGSKV